MEVADFLRNSLADCTADAAAEIFADHREAQAEDRWDGIAYQVAKRLAAIEAEVRANRPIAEWRQVPVVPQPASQDPRIFGQQLHKNIV